MTALASARGASSRGVIATTTRKVTGADAVAGQWGSVQVVITVSTKGSGKSSVRRFTDLGGQIHLPHEPFRVRDVAGAPDPAPGVSHRRAPKIHLVSGATYTSDAFEQSLQSALLKASA